MHPKFAEAIESLHSSFQNLIAMTPFSAGQLPRDMPQSGIYLFSEAGKDLYVGRSRNMRRRYQMHTRQGSSHNQASFAFLIAREAFGMSEASYKSGKMSRSELSENPTFIQEFEQAILRVRAMDYRFVEETNPTYQALLEIYCAVALDTQYNDFDTH